MIFDKTEFEEYDIRVKQHHSFYLTLTHIKKISEDEKAYDKILASYPRLNCSFYALSEVLEKLKNEPNKKQFFDLIQYVTSPGFEGNIDMLKPYPIKFPYYLYYKVSIQGEDVKSLEFIKARNIVE